MLNAGRAGSWPHEVVDAQLVTGKPNTALETPIYMKNSNIYKFMRGATPIWEGVPPRPRDLGGGYPYHHHHGFGAGAGVPGSPLPTTTIFHDFLKFLNFSQS